MDFSLSTEQLELKQSAADFGKKIRPEGGREADQEFSRDLWMQCAHFGVQGFVVPEEYGGLGRDVLSCALLMEGLGYGLDDLGLIFSINAHIWSGIFPLLRFGTPRQKKQYLPGLADGTKIAVHAMTEPETGSDAYGMKTKVVRCEGGFSISGTKTFITNGDVADLVLVFGKNENQRIQCVLVEKGTQGFEVSRRIPKMGLNSSPFAQLYFEHCRVAEENLVGPEGMGGLIFEETMAAERACILAATVGRMENQLEQCLEYAKIRCQFGKPIFDYQGVSHMLADMKIRLETSRLMVYKVAWLKSLGKTAAEESAMAKVVVSENAVQNSLAAMKVFGGYGYTREYPQERQLRDSLGGLFYSGTSEIMRNLIAELL